MSTFCGGSVSSATRDSSSPRASHSSREASSTRWNIALRIMTVKARTLPVTGRIGAATSR